MDHGISQHQTTIWDDIFGVLSKHFQLANPSSSDSSSRSIFFVVVGSSRPGFSTMEKRKEEVIFEGHGKAYKGVHGSDRN